MTRARDVANLIGSGNYSSTTFTATAGQTAFTIAHTQGFIQVFMNGLLLDETVDWTSDGSAVTLTSGAAAGDEIEVVAYNTFSVGDALNQAAADTRYVNATGDTMTGELVNDSIYLTNNLGQKLFMYRDSNVKYGLELQASEFRVFAEDQAAINLGHTSRSDGSTFTSRLGIDASGRVTTPNQPSFRAGKSASASGVGTVLTFDQVYLNVGSCYSSSNGRFTAPVAGVYYFGWQGISGHQTTSNEQNYYLAKNGTAVNDARCRGYTESSAHLKTIIDLAVNDYVDIRIGNSNTSTYNSAFHNQFMGVLLG